MIDQAQLNELRRLPLFSKVAVTQEMLESLDKLWGVARAADLLSTDLYLLRQAATSGVAYGIMQTPSFRDGVVYLLAQLAALK